MIQMADQNYVTNKLIKELVDKNQKGYVEVEEETNPQEVSNNNRFDVILNENDYNQLLADEESGLSRYYKKYPREDGIDADGNPVRDPDTEVVGHAFASAITAPTDPAETSSFPWIVLTLDNFIGNIDFQYDGESKFNWDISNVKQFAIVSVPNDLGMADYRLQWGTGATGEKTFNPELLDVIFTPTE